MALPIISIHQLGKCYQLAHQLKQHNSLRDLLTDAVVAPYRRLRQLQGRDETLEEFWALNDISFDVHAGDVIGIVGHNGAGKSTLLKILSRIVEPTRGSVTLRGRVASLLEVGTGFHPELSGRENIYLNGSILGMKKAEVDAKFDEIVDFAECERFLDTPVKRYSSGMYMRLAFAVAAHLEPEILIVDEVLAVGDAAFQAKCLGRMKEVSSTKGRTVLFVSHNLSAVSALCNRAVLLSKGKLVAQGSTAEVLNIYHSSYQRGREQVTVGTPALKWLGLANRRSLDELRLDADLTFDLRFATGSVPIDKLEIDCELIDENERCIVQCRSRLNHAPISVPPNTEFVARYDVSAPRLRPGHYRLNVRGCANDETLCSVEGVDACSISAESPYFPGLVLEATHGATLPNFRLAVSMPT
jgi:ABC-type polysaccharide/polyol phosphate transport system ATPase subunit